MYSSIIMSKIIGFCWKAEHLQKNSAKCPHEKSSSFKITAKVSRTPDQEAGDNNKHCGGDGVTTLITYVWDPTLSFMI